MGEEEKKRSNALIINFPAYKRNEHSIIFNFNLFIIL